MRKEFRKKCESLNHDIDPNFEKDCKFLNFGSRGKLSLPRESVNELFLCRYSYCKIEENKTSKKILEAFKEI